MEELPLQALAHSTAPSSQSSITEESPPTAFRFVDLPAEIRNQIYRYVLSHRRQPVRLIGYQGGPTLRDLAVVFTNRFIYFEAMPIFLSYNTFFITGTRTEHTWLRRMRPEGRSELRKIIFEVSPASYNHDYSVYNALSLCPQVHITLKVRPSRLSRAALEGALRNMHGFATVTSDTVPKETDLCARHRRDGVVAWERTLKRDQMGRIEPVLQQFRAPCVGKCRVHKGRRGTHTQATIHLSFLETCYYCC